jgi:hypothetical protein
MNTQTIDRFKRLVDDTARPLIMGGIRVISISTLHDQAMRTAKKQNIHGPSWAGLVAALQQMDGYDVGGFEDYTVTLPATPSPNPPASENLYTKVERVLAGIGVWRGDGSPAWDAKKVLDWVQVQLGGVVEEEVG